jgi:hypothetical protein
MKEAEFNVRYNSLSIDCESLLLLYAYQEADLHLMIDELEGWRLRSVLITNEWTKKLVNCENEFRVYPVAWIRAKRDCLQRAVIVFFKAHFSL